MNTAPPASTHAALRGTHLAPAPRASAIRPRRNPRRRGFSLVEMLVALTISSTLLAATLVALDVMFKRYTVISDSAGSQVVARVVVQRILSMIRTGSEFGPSPEDLFSSTDNPRDWDNIQFVSINDEAAGIRQITRIERRPAGTVTIGGENVTMRGPFVLWLAVQTNRAGAITTEERPLLDGVLDARFNLLYEPGPRLTRATVDITIQPRGSEYATFDAQAGTWSVMRFDERTQQWVLQSMQTTDATVPTVRLIATTSPRTGL